MDGTEYKQIQEMEKRIKALEDAVQRLTEIMARQTSDKLDAALQALKPGNQVQDATKNKKAG